MSPACSIEDRFVHHDHAMDRRLASQGAAIASPTARSDEEAAALLRRRRCRAGVPVNVIDKPTSCQFQFGSIVNRSPVVVGISTDGAAPILGQAIRRRIETLLPASLKSGRPLRSDPREHPCANARPRAPRRAFWERFVDRAFGAAPEAETEAGASRR